MSENIIVAIIMVSIIPLGIIGLFTWLSISAWKDSENIKFIDPEEFLNYQRMAEEWIATTYTYYKQPIVVIKDKSKYYRLPKGAYGRD